MFRRNGIHPLPLPLFSNFPVLAPAREPWLERACRAEAATSDPLWIGGFFGGLYPEWSPEPMFSILQSAARRMKRRLILASAGCLGGGESRWPELIKSYPGITFLRLGEMEPPQVSEYFQQLDFAISTTGWSRVTKSSSTASLLDHGVPVLVGPDHTQWREPLTESPSDHPLLIRVDESLEKRLMEGLPRRTPHQTAPEVAARFLADLRAAAPENLCV